jgi:Tol biopolymer transport system component
MREGKGRSAIYVRDSEGRVSRVTKPAGDRHPTWSPNGKQIAFDRDPRAESAEAAPHASVYIVDADGTNLKRLVAGASPAWSPNGDKILFTGYTPQPDESIPDLFTMNTDGGPRTKLTDAPSANGWEGSWSPDGKEIVFVSSRSEAELDGLWTMNADGGSPKLVRLEPYCTVGDPDWQPSEATR